MARWLGMAHTGMLETINATRKLQFLLQLYCGELALWQVCPMAVPDNTSPPLRLPHLLGPSWHFWHTTVRPSPPPSCLILTQSTGIECKLESIEATKMFTDSVHEGKHKMAQNLVGKGMVWEWGTRACQSPDQLHKKSEHSTLLDTTLSWATSANIWDLIDVIGEVTDECTLF